MRRFALVLSLVAPTLVHAAPPPPPPPPPSSPQVVPPTLLEGQRVAGEKNIVPDDVTKVEIQRSGKEKVVGSFKLCVSSAGLVQSVQLLKSTGFPAYDTRITTEMQRWQYRPFLVNRKAVPVCTAVTFIYSQRDAEVPKQLDPTALARLRTGGSLAVTLDRFTQAEMRAAGQALVVGTRTVCFTGTGEPLVTAGDARTGFYRFEYAIDALAKGWTFKPHVVAGKPERACGTLRIPYVVPRDAPAMIDGGVMHTLLGGKSLGPRQASGAGPKGGGWERDKDVMALVCIDAAGAVTQVELASHRLAAEGKGDGFADPADEAIAREIRGWRARPHTVAGKAQPACARVKLPFGP